jgi:uncharacterized protein (DUF488 family)
MLIYTVGHSTHPTEAFLHLLAQHHVELLIDVRSFPGSRRWPQFNRDMLEASVKGAGISYLWCQILGGRRKSRFADSPHRAWENSAFRSYAEYADSAEFAAGLEHLMRLAKAQQCAMMCSEGLWWRCHRRIIADHMVLLGWNVKHIMPNGKLVAHSLPAFARIDAARIIYDGELEL